MANRVTFSSIEATVQLLINHPVLFGVSGFSGLRTVVDLFKKGQTACGCDLNQTLQRYRPTFEQAITSFTEADIALIKKTLSVEQVCYYTGDRTGALTRFCL